MKLIFLMWACVSIHVVAAQELYPYTEPASNIPARSIGFKNMSMFHSDAHSSRTLHRHLLDVSFGATKNVMLRAGTSFSNMHEPKLVWEGVRLYAKYRFLSNDEVHQHFRMAAFASGTYTRNHFDHNEINLLMGEQSGVNAGLIATQLWNKFALSATGSWNEVLNKERWDEAHEGAHAVRSFNYSLSAGYLLLPLEYRNYDQININLYAELIGSRNLNFREKYFVDLAPSVQAIFKSAAKLNVGYRFQLGSDIYRITKSSWMVGFEYLFLRQ